MMGCWPGSEAAGRYMMLLASFCGQRVQQRRGLIRRGTQSATRRGTRRDYTMSFDDVAQLVMLLDDVTPMDDPDR